MLSKGEELLREYLELLLPNFLVKYNYRPSWLNGLELDIYFPDEKIGIEFNGDQHYFETDFGSPLAQNMRDKEKSEICRKNGVRLIVLEATDLCTKKIREICKGIVEIAHVNGRHRETHKESLARLKIKELRLLDIEAEKHRTILVTRFNSITALKRGDEKRKEAQAKALKVYAGTKVGISKEERAKAHKKDWRSNR